MTSSHPPAIRRFAEKVTFGGDDECWLWNGGTIAGYGKFLSDAGCYAHRFAFSFFKDEPLIAGHEILHTCDNRRCVNPFHLVQGTHADNMADMVAKGRQKNGPNAPRVGRGSW